MTQQCKWVWGPMKVTDVDQLQGVIVGVEWKCVAIDSDTGVNTSVTGVLDLPPPDPADFITLENVTAEIVNGWIALYMTNQNDIEAQCLQDLQGILNPVVKIYPFPAEPVVEPTPDPVVDPTPDPTPEP